MLATWWYTWTFCPRIMLSQAHLMLAEVKIPHKNSDALHPTEHDSVGLHCLQLAWRNVILDCSKRVWRCHMVSILITLKRNKTDRKKLTAKNKSLKQALSFVSLLRSTRYSNNFFYGVRPFVSKCDSGTRHLRPTNSFRGLIIGRVVCPLFYKKN